MKCHYIHDKEAGKVLIPGCMAVAVSNNIEDCTCRSTHKSIVEQVSWHEREIERMWKKIKQLSGIPKEVKDGQD